MMRKRWGCFLLCAGLLIGTIPVSYAADVQQQAETTQDEKSGTCGENATWELSEDGVLTIKGTGAVIKGSWNNEDVKKIIISEGITEIGDRALGFTVNATEVSIPNSMEKISYSAFEGSNLLQNESNWENGVYYCDRWVLDSQEDITTCVLRDDTRGMQDSAFRSCTKLQSIVIPDTIHYIGEMTFNYCINLSSVSLPKDLKIIGVDAFSSCKALSKLTIPEGVSCIEDYAFERSGLEKINIPNSVTTFGYSVFDGCEQLKDVKWSNQITTIPYHTFHGASSLEYFKIPENIISIGNDAFSNTNLKEIDIPESVTSIGDQAFACDPLRKVTMSDNVTEIGMSAFLGSALEDIKLSASLTSISDFMFQECKNLKSIDIPEGVTSIDYRSFASSGVVDCNFPSTLRQISEGAFIGCQNLKNIYYYGTESMFDNIQISEEGNAPLLNADVYIMMPFVDVPMSQYYAYPVMWAVANDITSGVDATHFAPNKSCTRAEIVTFLWNAAGRPSVNTNNPFKDVKKSDWYYQAVQWAVSENITAGVKRDEFAPSKTCTRAEVMTFLWNAEGQPTAQIKSPFKDVNTSDWFYQPVCWAVSESITAGTSPTTFGSKDACTRAHVVTFLHNYLDA